MTRIVRVQWRAAIGIILVTSLPCFTPNLSAARSVLGVESTYLGDGWFRYTVQSTDDPYFLFFDIVGVSLPGATVTEVSPAPSGWTNTAQTSWQFDGYGLGDQARPYQATFMVRSSERTFKRAATGTILMSFSIVGGYHGELASMNIVGYWNAEVLVPCPPAEADHSPTNLFVHCPGLMLPEPRIESLVRSGPHPVGLTFDYTEPSTTRLEATRDFKTWTNIAYIHGNSGVTTWITNRALSGFGDFFRLRLVAEGHATNMPPLNSTSAQSVIAKSIPKTSLPVRLQGARMKGNQTSLTFVNREGNDCRISLLDSSFRPTSPISIKGNSTSILLLGRSSSAFYQVSND